MEKLFIPGAIAVMFIAGNEILSLSIMLGFMVWVIIKIMEGY